MLEGSRSFEMLASPSAASNARWQVAQHDAIVRANLSQCTIR